MEFIPKECKEYYFELPLRIFGIGSIDSISRNVIGEGLKPRIIIQPQLIEFKRRIISNVGKMLEVYQEIEVSMLGKTPVQWYIDTSNLELDSIFKLVPTSGTVFSQHETQIIKV